MGQRELEDAIAALLAGTAYYACLLVVDPDPRVLTEEAARLLAAHGWAALSVGRGLSAALLPEPAGIRGRAAQRWMRDRLAELAPGPVLCTETDLLFEPTLGLDPLSLVRRASRATRLVATWSGTYEAGVLAYATPEHGHYRAWSRPDVPVVRLS